MKIKSVLDDMISQINPDLSSIEITNSDMMTQLNLLKSSQLDFINFTSYNALVSWHINLLTFIDVANVRNRNKER